AVQRGRPEKAHARSDKGQGGAHGCEFLMVDDGPQYAEAAATVVLGPIDTCPASRRELLEPFDPPVPFAFVFREEVEVIVFTFGPVLVEPGAELRAKLFVFGREIEVHRSSPSVCAAAFSLAYDWFA